MTQEHKVNSLIQYFSQQPELKTELHYDTPFQLLVAVVLSAQCADKRVNSQTISYPNNKTKVYQIYLV